MSPALIQTHSHTGDLPDHVLRDVLPLAGGAGAPVIPGLMEPITEISELEAFVEETRGLLSRYED